MSDDLISREALKKALTSKDLITWTHEYGDAIPVDWLMSVIDNAPTVESDYEWGYSEGVHDTERPQGEWNEIQAGMFVCNLCGATPHKQYKNFCPKCGADMRKGGAK